MTDYATPNSKNYHIAKGIAYFKPSGDTVYRDLGMLAEFTISRSSSLLEKNDTREGVGLVDMAITTKLKQTIKVTMTEIVPENMALASAGTATRQTDGKWKVSIFTDINKNGLLKIVGTNDYGAKITWEGKVQVSPDGDVPLLTEDDKFSQITITCTSLKDTVLGYGEFTFPADA